MREPSTRLSTSPEAERAERRFESSRIEEMVDDLLSRELIAANRPYGIGVIRGSDPSSDAARSVEYAVFDETFGNNYDVMEQEYAPYDEDSIFLLAVDVGSKKPFGTIRFIQNGENGLKTVNDVKSIEGPWGKDMPRLIEEHLQHRAHLPEEYKAFEADKTLDLGTLAVSREYRKDKSLSGVASACLYRAGGVYTLKNGFRDWVTIIDEKPFELIQAGFDNALERIPGLDGASYLDSPTSFPAYINVEAYFDRMDRSNSGVAAFLENGDVLTKDFSFCPETS